MTLADLIRKLQELNADSNTPVHFYANDYDAEEPLIDLAHIGSRQEIGVHIHSPEVEKLLNECYEGFC